MNDERVRTEAGVCLVGGGDVCPEVLAKALKFATVVVAADGGADVALKAGLMPHAVIGDFDSISETARSQLPADRLVEVTEQDSTDFEKSLSRIDAPYVIAVGFTGRRLDHTLATMSVLARHVGPPTVVIDAFEAVFAPRESVRLAVDAGTRVSLFPMAAVEGRSAGLFWPIDGLKFSPAGKIGTSNKSNGAVDLEFDEPGMLVLLPLTELDVVIAGLIG